MRRIKFGIAAKHINAKRFESLLRIIRRNLRATRAHALEDFVKIELRFRFAQSPVFRATYLVDQTRRGNKRLAWNATEVEAIAAHLVAFDQGNATAQSRCSRGGDKSGRARADDDDIVNAFAFCLSCHRRRLRLI